MLYSYFEIFYQTVLAFGSILILTMLLGKQQIAEMTPFEYVNGITFGSIAAEMAIDLERHTAQHFFGLFLFAMLTLGMSYFVMKSRRSRKYLEGEPSVVIQNGKVLENKMRKHRFSMNEVMQMLREKNVFDISHVQYAILENDGGISVMLKPEHQPLTLNQIKNPSSKTPQIPMELVVDGQIIYENLRLIGKDGKWLMEQIRKKASIGSIHQVFYAVLETDGTLFVDKKDQKDK